MVRVVPPIAGPIAGCTAVIVGAPVAAATYVYGPSEMARPPSVLVTTIGTAPATIVGGVVTVIAVAELCAIAAAAPPKRTEAASNPVPWIVTLCPPVTGP